MFPLPVCWQKVFLPPASEPGSVTDSALVLQQSTGGYQMVRDRREGKGPRATRASKGYQCR
jgi:hypothetical protein